MESIYGYGGVSDYGLGREVNEDFLTFEVLREDILFAVIADGAGSKQCGFAIQPAVVAAVEATEVVKHFFAINAEMVEKYPVEILSEAMRTANRMIGVMKSSNEENYSGFGVCMTCCLVCKNQFYFAHSGNTRIYLIRHLPDNSARILRLSNDHTKAAEMVADGLLAEEEYYGHPGRYLFTSGLGFSTNPTVQTFAGTLQKGDILVLTTDGIHYAIREEAIADIILSTGNWKDAAQMLIEGAKMQKIKDNMSAAMIFMI